MCEERYCALNEIDWSGVSEGNVECTRDTILSTATNSNCTLECLPGYRNVATDGVVRCGGELGVLDDSGLNCTENQCSPIVFNSSMSVLSNSENRDDVCENNTILSTHSNARCVLLLNNEIHTAECVTTALQGDDVVFRVGAEPRCAYYDETCGRLGAGKECTCGVRVVFELFCEESLEQTNKQHNTQQVRSSAARDTWEFRERSNALRTQQTVMMWM